MMRGSRRVVDMADTAQQTYTLRRLGQDDKLLLAAATLANVNWSGPRFTMEQIMKMPKIAHYFAPWPEDRQFGVVASETSGDVGVAWARYFTADDPGYGFVDERMPELSVWVAMHHRGRGLGASLLQTLIARARANNAPGVSLSVEEGNPARRIYDRLGFVPVEDAAEPGTLVLRF